MNYDYETMTIARTRAGEEHRQTGGEGPPSEELIQRHAEAITAKMAPAPVAERAAPAPTLTATVPALRTLRSIDGKSVPVFTRTDKLAAHAGPSEGLNLEGLGAALAGIISGNTNGVRAELRALNEGSGSAGGFLVPDELSSMIVDLARAKSVVFQAGAMTVPMASETLKIVRILTDPTTAEVAEGVSIPESDGSFDALNLVARKLAVLTSATSELLDDGVGAGDAIINSLAASMASAMDDYILDKIFANNEIGIEESVGGIVYADMLKALHDVRLLNGEADSVICHPSLPYDLSLLLEATTNAFLAPPAQLAGLRYFESTRVSDDHALVGDFTKAVVGIRRGMSIDISREAGTAFAMDKSFIRGTVRLDSGVLRPHFRILDGIS